jgi:hypothetical protein
LSGRAIVADRHCVLHLVFLEKTMMIVPHSHLSYLLENAACLCLCLYRANHECATETMKRVRVDAVLRLDVHSGHLHDLCWKHDPWMSIALHFGPRCHASACDCCPYYPLGCGFVADCCCWSLDAASVL